VTDRIVAYERIVAARTALEGRVNRTPMLSCSTAAAVVAAASGRRVAGDRIHLKAEHLQKTGSFKARATRTKVAALTAEQRAAGIVTMSAGNAGAAYAWAAREAGIHAVVAMPEGAVRSKVEACIGYGAEVVLQGAHVGDVWLKAQELVRERGLEFCPPFDDPDVIAGNGSVGLEILDDLPDVDVVVVGVGGGLRCRARAV
jgi:threonine dehydratase